MTQTIALVDDDRNILTSISIALEKEGFKVQTYLDGESALIGLSRTPPDLAIIDIKLDKPDKDGIDLLKLVTQIDKLTPVIMISGHATVSIAVEATRLGAYEFIEKPFSKEKAKEQLYEKQTGKKIDRMCIVRLPKDDSEIEVRRVLSKNQHLKAFLGLLSAYKSVQLFKDQTKKYKQKIKKGKNVVSKK